MLRKMSMFLLIFALSTLSVQAATVSGVVKAGDSTGVAVDSAIVTLTIGTGGGAQTLRDTTDATGAYSITSTLLRIGTDQIRAAKTGYVTMPQSAINITDSTATYTQNLYLVSASIRATVSGIVTDSVAGTPLSGAKVLLRIGGGGPARDSVVTGATGAYSFDTVPAGNFTLAASDSGYNFRNTTGYVGSATAQTIAIKLVKILYGSITGTVTDSVAATAVAGAKVYLRTTGGGTAIDSAITAANGSYTITHVQTGIARSLRAQDSGYVTKSIAVTVPDTAALTVNIQIVKILYGSIIGTVTDSVATTPIAGAKVYLRTTGGGGGTALDSAITAANGSYTITNVQSGIARTLRVQDSGYVTKNTAVTVVGAAALTVNVELRKSAVSIVSPKAQVAAGNPDFGIARSGLLRLNNFTDAGEVKVFNSSGKLLYRCAISDHTTFLTLPKSIAKSGNAVIISVSQQNVTYRKQIMMP